MEFRLLYNGVLKSNGRPAEKQAIRRALHPQLKRLFDFPPLAFEKKYWLSDPSDENKGSIIRKHLAPFVFAPLVTEKNFMLAELDVLLLTPEPPGSVITQSGDIDNRLKTLFDALRMPTKAAELPQGDVPAADEEPLFCVLEDDALVTKVTVTKDILLRPAPVNEVSLVLTIRTRTYQVKGWNIRMAAV